MLGNFRRTVNLFDTTTCGFRPYFSPSRSLCRQRFRSRPRRAPSCSGLARQAAQYPARRGPIQSGAVGRVRDRRPGEGAVPAGWRPVPRAREQHQAGRHLDRDCAPASRLPGPHQSLHTAPSPAACCRGIWCSMAAATRHSRNAVSASTRWPPAPAIPLSRPWVPSPIPCGQEACDGSTASWWETGRTLSPR